MLIIYLIRMSNKRGSEDSPGISQENFGIFTQGTILMRMVELVMAMCNGCDTGHLAHYTL